MFSLILPQREKSGFQTRIKLFRYRSRHDSDEFSRKISAVPSVLFECLWQGNLLHTLELSNEANTELFHSLATIQYSLLEIYSEF